MEFEYIQYQKNGGCATITLNRPEVFNAFHKGLHQDVQAGLLLAEEDDEVRVIVLTGAGKAFCSGQDLKAVLDDPSFSFEETVYEGYNPIIEKLRNIQKPIIGKINGVAAGAGCSIALACDFIIASEKASFIEVFVNIGLVLDSGSSYFLPRLVGTARAFELATMGNKLKPQQAFDWGMINRVCAPEELDSVTQEVVDYYQNAPTKAIGMMKRMLNQSHQNSLSEMLKIEGECQKIAGESDDYKEGVASFIEKRGPKFTGK